ncbi:MAG: pilus assembly protein PilP [Nitrospirota bacterium]
MSLLTRKKMIYKESGNLMKPVMVNFCIMIIIVVFFSACGEKPAPPPKKPLKQAPAAEAPQPAASQTEAGVTETPEQAGYVYQQRDRRDPFVPLIVPKKKTAKVQGTRTGNLVSYDIGDFTLAAIASKGDHYYGLLTTPDNRSFIVYKGTPIGLYNGKVEEITKNKIIIVEYSSDFKGELKPRQIILEFHKGEVE